MKLAKNFVDIDSDDREPAETTIKGYMPIGSINGSGSVSVSAFEVVVPSREIVFHGVRFEVNSGGDYPNEGLVTVAVENAEKLLASIEKLASVKIDTRRYALLEVESTVDDLRIVVFNTAQGRLHAAIEAGGASCHLMKQSDLFDLHKLVQMAVDYLHAKAL